jgi:hypothetical protein
MRSAIFLVGLCLVTIVLCGGTTGSDNYFLDLTIPGMQDRSLEENIGWGGGVGLSSAPEVPLAVELKSVDKELYMVGSDVLIYEMCITNQGNTNVAIPWTPYRALVWKGYRPGKRLVGLEATIGLEIVGKDRVVALDARGLYSKPDDPKSFIVLAPNESAVIKASRRIEVAASALSESKDRCGQVSKRMVVRASFNLTDWSQGGYYKRIESRNLKGIVLNWNGCGK